VTGIRTRIAKIEKVFGACAPEIPLSLVVLLVTHQHWADLSAEQQREIEQRIEAAAAEGRAEGEGIVLVHDIPFDYPGGR
jgi:hypothetical protein